MVFSVSIFHLFAFKTIWLLRLWISKRMNKSSSLFKTMDSKSSDFLEKRKNILKIVVSDSCLCLPKTHDDLSRCKIWFSTLRICNYSVIMVNLQWLVLLYVHYLGACRQLVLNKVSDHIYSICCEKHHISRLALYDRTIRMKVDTSYASRHEGFVWTTP